MIPDIPSCRAGTLLSALIVVFCAIGLTLHSDFYAGIRRRDFFYYYTNVSNLIVLFYFALLAPRLYSSPSLRSLIPHAEFAVTACIMLTCIVFHLLLLPGLVGELRAAVQETGEGAVRLTVLLNAALRSRDAAILLWDNLLIHALVPLLTLLYWLFCAPDKHMLTLADAVVWLAVPAVYLCAVFLRAAGGAALHGTKSPYPYPFMDPIRLGAHRVRLICMRILFSALAVSLLCVLFAQRMASP